MLLADAYDLACDFYAFLRVIVYSSDTLQQMPTNTNVRAAGKTFCRYNEESISFNLKKGKLSGWV